MLDRLLRRSLYYLIRYEESELSERWWMKGISYRLWKLKEGINWLRGTESIYDDEPGLVLFLSARPRLHFSLIPLDKYPSFSLQLLP